MQWWFHTLAVTFCLLLPLSQYQTSASFSVALPIRDGQTKKPSRRRRKHSSSPTRGWWSTTEQQLTHRRHVRLYLAQENTEVRTLMQYLHRKLPESATIPQMWRKTRQYLYQQQKTNKWDQWSLSQVQQVLDCLHEFLEGDSQLVAWVLQQSPRILRRNVPQSLRPTLVFLRQLYGPDMFLQAVQRNPDLLLTHGVGYDAGSLNMVEVYLRQEMHLPEQRIEKVKKQSPFLFQLPMSQLLSTVDYLKGILDKAGYPPDKVHMLVSQLIETRPQIIQLSIENNLKPRLDFLQERLDLSDTELACWFEKSNSAILGLSVEANLKPTLDFLQTLVNPSELKKAVRSHPPLLGLSLTNLQEKVSYFQGLEEPSSHSRLAGRILAKCPSVYSLSLGQNIQPTIEFLSRIWGATPPKRQHVLAHRLCEYPTILTLSLEGNIRPTVHFYNRTGYIQLDDTWNLDTPPEDDNEDDDMGSSSSSKRPLVLPGRYISSSLFNRLLPRWHYCMPKSSPTTLSLHLLAMASDAAFCQAMDLDLEDYLQFKIDAVPQLKFSSQFDTWLKTGRPINRA
jgi:hypothetical protein